MNKKKYFSKIYDQFVDKIYRFIFLRVNSEEIAKDLTSETFTKVWHAFQNSEIKNLKAFLYKTARNLTTDFYREKAKISHASLENLPPIADPKRNPQEKVIFEEKMEKIRKSLNNLREDYRQVIILRYIDGLSIKEISEIMERSPGAVRVLIHRALESLKRECNKKEGFSSS